MVKIVAVANDQAMQIIYIYIYTHTYTCDKKRVIYIYIYMLHLFPISHENPWGDICVL